MAENNTVTLRDRDRLTLRDVARERIVTSKPEENEARIKAGLATGAAFPEVEPNTFEEVQTEILNTGGSSFVDRVRQAAEQRKRVEKEEEIEAVLIDPNTPIEQKQQIIQEVVDRPEDVSLNEEFERTLVNQASASTGSSREIQRSIIDYWLFKTEMPEVSRRIQAEELSYNPDNALGDVLQGIALPGYGVQIFEVLNAGLPGFAEGGDLALPGTMAERFIETVTQLPHQEQEAVLRRVAKAIEKNTFFGRDNDFIKADLFQTLLGELKPSRSREIFLNAISFLDLLALGEFVRIGGAAFRVAKSGVQMARRGELSQKIINNYLNRKRPQSIASKMDTLAPEDSKRVAQDSLEGNVDPEDIGETTETMTQAHVASEPTNVSPTAAPSIHDPQDEVLGYDGRALGWTNIERLGLQNRAIERLEAIQSIAPRLHLNKTQFEPLNLADHGTEGGLRATTYIGQGDRGFATFKEARSAMRKLRGEFPTEIHVVDRRTNEIKPIEDVPIDARGSRNRPNNAEYFLRFQEDLKYSAEDAIGINPVLENGITGELAKFATKSSVFGRWFSLATSAAGDAKAARNRALSDILSPLTKLKNKDRAIVEDVIDRGDQIGKFFSEDELLLEWANKTPRKQEQLLEAYRGFQRFQQETWRLVNDGMRERLDALGMKEIHLPRMGQMDSRTMGRVVPRGPKAGDTVYDPTTNTIRPLTADEFLAAEEELAAANKTNTAKPRSFIEFRNPLRLNKDEAQWALNKGNRGDLRINALPANVVKNVPGRLPRLYEVTHLVKKRVERWRNGEKLPDGLIPVSMARDSGSALRTADEMELAEFGKINPNDRKYQVVPAREIREDAEYANRTSLDFHEDTGSFWYSDRGLELDGVDGLRPVAPVMERLDLMRERASRIGTLEPLVLKLKRNMDNEFGQEFGIDIDGVRQIPLYGDLPRNIPFTRTEKGLAERRFRDLVATRNYLKLLAGIDEGTLQRKISQAAVYMADRLATSKVLPSAQRAKERGAQFLLRHRNFDPVNKAKQAAFLAYIVGNPARQLALQMQQASVYTTEQHALRYFATGQGVRDWLGMVGGLATRDNPAVFASTAKSMAAGMGMTVDEYVEFVDSIRKSGLLANIDSHAFSAGMIADKTFGGSSGFTRIYDTALQNTVAQAGRRTKDKAYDALNGITRAAKLMRKMGFDAGEASHLISAFLVKRNQWIRNNPTKSKLWAQAENLSEIAGGARQISFEMTREGALGFQKGLLGLIFQFASHNTKALQALIPRTIPFTDKQLPVLGKLGNAAFNNKQKAAIAMSQLSYYGVGGFGLYESYEELKAFLGDEPPEEVDLLIKEGLFGSLVTALTRAQFDEPGEISDLDVSGSLAPFSGVTKVPIFRTLADATALGVFDFRNIPVVSVGDDVREAIDTIGFLTGTLGYPGFDEELVNLSDTDRTLLVLDEIARLVPVYNKAMKARAELAINRLISNSGDERVTATGSEILLKAILGVQPTAERQSFQISTDLGGLRTGGFRDEPVNQELKDYADNIYKNIKKILQRTGDNKQAIRESLNFAKAVARVDRELLTDFEYRFVHQQQIPQIMYSDLADDSEDAKIIKKLESLLENGDIETTDSIIDRIGQSEVLNNDRYARYLRELGE